MVTRIPQPQFVGPAPSEAVTQAGSLAQRAAEMFMQGIQEGARNYTAQQQVNAEKERNQIEVKKQQSESDRFHMSLLSQDLQTDLLNNGAMTYVDRKDEWLKYFGFLSNGDPKLAESMYEGGAGALNRMSATEMLGAGLIGKAPSDQGQAGSSPRNRSSRTDASSCSSSFSCSSYESSCNDPTSITFSISNGTRTDRICFNT